MEMSSFCLCYWRPFSLDLEPCQADGFPPPHFSSLVMSFCFFWPPKFLMRGLWLFESLFLDVMCLLSLAAFEVFYFSLIFSSLSVYVNLCLSLDLESEVFLFFVFVLFWDFLGHYFFKHLFWAKNNNFFLYSSVSFFLGLQLWIC